MKRIFVLAGLLVLLISFCGCNGQKTAEEKTENLYAAEHFRIAYPLTWNLSRPDNTSILLVSPQEGENDFLEYYRVVALPPVTDFPQEDAAMKDLFIQELDKFNESKLLYGSCINESGGRICNFIYSYNLDGTILKQKQVMFIRKDVFCQTIYSALPETYDKYLKEADAMTSSLECF